MKLCTPCQSCSFLSKEGGGCLLNLYCCTSDDNVTYAPGCCRFFTRTKFPDITTAVRHMKQAMSFDYSLVVCFDNKVHSLDDLRRVFRKSVKYTNIVVVDMSATSDPKELVELSRHCVANSCKYNVVIPTEPIVANDQLVRLAMPSITQNYFVVIDANEYIDIETHKSVVAETNQNSRFVRWDFGKIQGNTLIFSQASIRGVYITSFYREMMCGEERSFNSVVRELESDSGIGFIRQLIGPINTVDRT